jgi:L-cystine uptake protein TcyP (sodium:dicarboxylate symporter family)
VGNIFSGQVVGETAKSLSNGLASITETPEFNHQSKCKSTSISTQVNSLIPQNLTLTQGVFVGAVSDNFDERETEQIFHSEIVVDNEK